MTVAHLQFSPAIAKRATLTCAAIDPSATRVYFGSNTGSVFVCDDREVLREFVGHSGVVSSVWLVGRYLVTTGSDGKVVRWTVSPSDRDILAADSTMSVPVEQIRCGVSVDSNRVIIGTTSGNILSMDFSYGGCPVVIVPGSQSQLLSVDTHPGTHVFVTGSASGIVSMWDCTANKKLVDLLLPRGVCSVRFSPDGSLLVCGLIKPSGPDRDDSGTHASSTAKNKHKLEAAEAVDVDGAEIIVFRCRVVHADDADADEYVPGGDVESKSVAFGTQATQVQGVEGSESDDIFPHTRVQSKKPIVAVALSPLQNILQPFRMVSVLCLRFCGDLPTVGDGSMLAVGYSDSIVDIFVRNRHEFVKKRTLKGHRGDVLQVDWSSDNRYLRSVSSVYELFFWDVDSGLRVKFVSLLSDTTWLTESCVLGWHTMGIWPTDCNGTEITTAVVNHTLHSSTKRVLAAADDTGTLRLFKYPVVMPNAPYKALRGHSRIVTAMAFSFDNAWLVSVGGEDSAAFKWRVSAEPEVAVDASSKTVWFTVPGAATRASVKAGGVPDPIASMAGTPTAFTTLRQPQSARMPPDLSLGEVGVGSGSGSAAPSSAPGPRPGSAVDDVGEDGYAGVSVEEKHRVDERMRDNARRSLLAPFSNLNSAPTPRQKVLRTRGGHVAARRTQTQGSTGARAPRTHVEASESGSDSEGTDKGTTS